MVQNLTALLQDLYSLINSLKPLILLAAVALVLSSILSWFSMDRVLKLARGRNVVLFTVDKDGDGKLDAYYGKLMAPSFGSGGFEIHYPIGGARHVGSLIAYLKQAYRETGQEKYLKMSDQLIHIAKDAGIDVQKAVEEAERYPYTSPPEFSLKIYSSQIDDVYAVARFKDWMSDEEAHARAMEIERFFHPSLVQRLKRRIYNAIAYVKDKIAKATASITMPLTGVLPSEVKGVIQEYQAKMLQTMKSYDPMLENSIGKLVKVLVKENGSRYYQGFLREYSDSYLYIYNVPFRLKVIQTFEKTELEYTPHGWKTEMLKLLKLRRKGSRCLVENPREIPVLVKIKCGEEEKELFMQPSSRAMINCPEPTLEYEVIIYADVIWPRSKATVLGLAEPLSLE